MQIAKGGMWIIIILPTNRNVFYCYVKSDIYLVSSNYYKNKKNGRLF